MHTSRALIFFSLVVLSRSASFNTRNANDETGNYKSELVKANDETGNFHSEPENAIDELGNVNNEVGNANNEPSSEVTAFDYHMKIGVPKAIELLKSEGVQTKIVGGSQVASTTVIPHQAGIVARLTTGWQSICGGSLISNTRVLTAAHCWWDGVNQANLFTIVLGSLTIFTGGTRIATSAVTVHPNWNTRDITNDIAMVTITSVAYNNNIQAIPLPSLSAVNLDFAGLTGTVSGFGKTSDAQSSTLAASLYQVSVNIISNSVCQNSFTGISLHGSHLCTSGTGNVGSCDGDSGGPLTVLHNNSRTLVGVVSFGLSEGCQFGKPSVYTRVTAFHNWIQANM